MRRLPCCLVWLVLLPCERKNWRVHYDRTELREPRRVVRLLVMLRSWFDGPQAVDLRKYDQMVLDVVKKRNDR